MAAICVYCASSPHVPGHYLELAAEVGASLARRGHSVISGGGAISMMGALARAARAGGAHTTGVIPEALVGLEVADLAADELVVVPDMRARKQRMDDSADAFLALPGGIGTLEELMEVWTSRSLGMHSKPVVVLDPDGCFAPLQGQVALMLERGLVRPSALTCVQWCTQVNEAIDAIEGELRVTPGFVSG